MTKYKITIEVTYLGDGADPSNVLDSIQDNAKGLLEAYGDTVENFEVCVEELNAQNSV